MSTPLYPDHPTLMAGNIYITSIDGWDIYTRREHAISHYLWAVGSSDHRMTSFIQTSGQGSEHHPGTPESVMEFARSYLALTA